MTWQNPGMPNPPRARVVAAADIGATSMRAAIVTSDGRLVARAQTPTEAARGIDDATERLVALVRDVAERAGAVPAAMGVSTAGPVDPATGDYRFPPNLPGWHDRTMQPTLARTLGVPARVGHDATLAAMAEVRWGHRRGVSDLLYLTVSTGIGAGIVAGGQPVTGSTGGAGEVGHLIVNPGGRSCGAGCGGCLEGAASGSAIASEGSRLLGEPVTAEGVLRRAAAGDETAGAIVREAIGHLGAGLAGLLAVFDPAVIVVGGGVARGLEPRWSEVIEAVRERALPRYREHVPVELTTLGDDASLLGAAVVAFQEVGSGA